MANAVVMLKNCPTNGCTEATAKPENISSPGVAASQEIARRDMKNLSTVRLTGFYQESCPKAQRSRSDYCCPC